MSNLRYEARPLLIALKKAEEKLKANQEKKKSREKK